jgi:hypothetical protein
LLLSNFERCENKNPAESAIDFFFDFFSCGTDGVLGLGVGGLGVAGEGADFLSCLAARCFSYGLLRDA